jgi:hypothetical protein
VAGNDHPEFSKPVMVAGTNTHPDPFWEQKGTESEVLRGRLSACECEQFRNKGHKVLFNGGG